MRQFFKYKSWISIQYIICSVLFYTHAVQAQTSTSTVESNIDEVIVNTSKIEQKISHSLPASYAIDMHTYQQNEPYAFTLNDVLRQQQGFEVKQLGGAGTQTSIFSRSAANSKQTLVLLDGIPINSLSHGGASIQNLSLSHIAQAEALLGTASSLYGSQAMGGLVSFITIPKLRVSAQQLNQYKPNLAFKLGSNHTRQINTGFDASHYQPENNQIISYGINLADLRTDGINAMNQAIYPDSNADKDGYKQKSANAYIKYQQQNNELSLQAGHINTKGAYDSAYSLPSAEQRYVNKFSHIGLNYTQNFTDKLKAKFKLGFNENRNENIEDNKQTSDFVDQNKYVSTQFDYQFLPRNTLSFQIEGLKQTLNSQNIQYDENKRSTYSTRLGYIGAIQQHNLQANIRLDKVSNIDAHTSYFLGYGYNFTPNWKAFATYSTGFRAPSFDELYYPKYSNPKLTPEYNTSIETGVQYADNNLFLRTSLYQSRYRDLIAYDSKTYNLINMNKAKILGIEQAVRFKINKNNALYANINWQKPEQTDISSGNAVSGKILAKANLFGNVGIQSVLDVYGKPLTIGTNMHFTSSKLDYPKERLNGYAWFDANMTYVLHRDIALQFGVSNIFNRKNTQDAYGYNKSGRTVFTQISFSPR
jgi:vitamin B12 transporter